MINPAIGAVAAGVGIISSVYAMFNEAEDKEKKRLIKPVTDYKVDNVSKKIVRIIISYVDYVNRTVWHKEV